MNLYTARHQELVGGEGWHCDSTSRDQPPCVSLQQSDCVSRGPGWLGGKQPKPVRRGDVMIVHLGIVARRSHAREPDISAGLSSTR